MTTTRCAPLLAVLAVARASLGACSSGDDDASGDSTSHHDGRRGRCSSRSRATCSTGATCPTSPASSSTTPAPSLNTCVYTSSDGPVRHRRRTSRSIGERHRRSRPSTRRPTRPATTGTVQELELDRRRRRLRRASSAGVAHRGGDRGRASSAILTGGTLERRRRSRARSSQDLATILATRRRGERGVGTE